VVGATLGVLGTVSSIGAGAIDVVALLILYPKMPTAKIVGSDIVLTSWQVWAAGPSDRFIGPSSGPCSPVHCPASYSAVCSQSALR
jgi:hypothetical protein